MPSRSGRQGLHGHRWQGVLDIAHHRYPRVSRRPRFVIPLAGLRAGAMVGDLIHRLTGRRLPLDSDVLHRLFGNAEYEATSLVRDAGFTPRQTLSDLAGSMVAAARDSP